MHGVAPSHDMTEISSFLEFIEPMAELVDRLRAERRRETASDFSPFRYLQTGELGLSRIIGDFLDPAGPHCQGDVYLRDFLKRVGLPQADTTGAVVRVEEALRSGRRIDIVVRGPGWICAIENKPFAADQHRQLTDYWEEIKAEVSEGGARLVYLSGTGSLPSAESLTAQEAERMIACGEFFVFSYGDSGGDDEFGICELDTMIERWQNASHPEVFARSYLGFEIILSPHSVQELQS